MLYIPEGCEHPGSEYRSRVPSVGAIRAQERHRSTPFLAGFPDPRQRRKLIYPLDEVLLLLLLAVLAGAETFAHLAWFDQRSALSRRFSPFRDATPSPRPTWRYFARHPDR